MHIYQHHKGSFSYVKSVWCIVLNAKAIHLLCAVDLSIQDGSVAPSERKDMKDLSHDLEKKHDNLFNHPYTFSSIFKVLLLLR